MGEHTDFKAGDRVIYAGQVFEVLYLSREGDVTRLKPEDIGGHYTLSTKSFLREARLLDPAPEVADEPVVTEDRMAKARAAKAAKAVPSE